MAEREIKINLGSGSRTLPGFDNIDNSPSVFLARHLWLKTALYRLRVLSKGHYETQWPPDIIWRSAARRLPYADGSVAKIYSSHFLEHVRRKRAIGVLRECHRVLRPGGVFRLVVPDLWHHARVYVEATAALMESDQAVRDAHDRFLYTVCGGFIERRRSAHYYMYDWPTMKRLLPELGFVDVRRMKYQESADGELGTLDNRPEESLYVEMTVPGAPGRGSDRA